MLQSIIEEVFNFPW